jgi:hypothetical protein
VVVVPIVTCPSAAYPKGRDFLGEISLGNLVRKWLLRDNEGENFRGLAK